MAHSWSDQILKLSFDFAWLQIQGKISVLDALELHVNGVKMVLKLETAKTTFYQLDDLLYAPKFSDERKGQKRLDSDWSVT